MDQDIGNYKNPNGSEEDFPKTESRHTGANIQRKISDKMHKAAETLEREITDHDQESPMARYGEKASEWLHQSAQYVDEFDFKHEEARVRKYVGECPGKSLLIAGVTGLILGAALRRR